MVVDLFIEVGESGRRKVRKERKHERILLLSYINNDKIFVPGFLFFNHVYLGRTLVLLFIKQQEYV